ncbi:hypothetical protein BHM03_00033460 [Ensete ventricosum]|nr:hypothetical protein BHM03_00033460 [Ensete ventricosum]
MYWCARCSILGRVVGGRSISDQKNLDGLSLVKNAWMARDGWRSGIPWTCDRCRSIKCRSRSRSVPDYRSDFVIGLASGSGKLRGLRRPEAVAALPRAGPPGSGPLVTLFAGVPPGEPIGEPSNARAGAGYRTMVCTIPANAWTWLVRPRKASAVTMNDVGLDAGEGNPGSVIILQKRLGVSTATIASSVGRGWSGSGWCSAPEFPNGRSCDMGPPSSAKMLEPNLVPAQWIRSAPVAAERALLVQSLVR